ncbi:TonB-dependent receptor plug domain-containing protein [Reichenbachiella versicolor]|uniref:TonB-dependent receptor plug domain-containing protein n=1 Tax=Reichenbachiella versicolor TaxID=1821036 RepID=UPI000D6E2FEB|nr:TonB-dependent receptor plug domain-containing protein [Reichenbachiella versicolor]
MNPIRSLKVMVLAFCYLVLPPQAIAQELFPQDDILSMSLEDLMNIEVTSVSKKAERLQDVASAIYVVNSDDIRQSGATTLHEILRDVPGYWGTQDEYNSVYSGIRVSQPYNADPQTVLYLLDGTPLQELMGQTFSFINFDIPLDEIERIEVISGSGGTIYGANSATGVISIFTKDPDKYDGINVRAEGATPGYANATIRAGGKINDKLAISGYTKYRYFSGWESLAGKFEDGANNETLGENGTAFTKDFNKSMYYSLGLKANYNISSKDKISFRSHFNGRQKTTYTNSLGKEFLFERTDIKHENDINASRFVGNIRYDHNFSDKHSFFLRASTNIENDFYRLAGGMDISNAIYDFEIQDNISIGAFNDLSFGANYRLVNFDIHNIVAPNQIQYLDPKANESLKGAFIQDKLKLLDGKLNFTAGIKAENYSLVNDKYYISPMAKVAGIVNERFTVWGGFTQSYTTPGFNNTNIDWFLFQSASDETYDLVIYDQIYNQTATQVADLVFLDAYNTARNGGASQEEAVNSANDFISSDLGQSTIKSNTEAYIQSEEGQALLNGTTQNVKDQTLTTAVKNGSNTTPTQFQTWELGFKAQLYSHSQVNATLFHTNISDAVSASPGDPLASQLNQPSITRPNEQVNYYLYGNYMKGVNKGVELSVQAFPREDIVYKFSYTYQTTEWELQDNPDFSSDIIENTEEAPATPFMPEHIFRFRLTQSFGDHLTFNIQTIYASKHFSELNYFYDRLERYEMVAENDLRDLDAALGLEENQGYDFTPVAVNNDRFILNARVEKRFLDGKLTAYVFGNDILNEGRVMRTDQLRNVTLSQIGAMYGLGFNYRLK